MKEPSIEGGQDRPESIRLAEASFEKFTRETIEVLIDYGIPGTREEIYAYLHEDYDPTVYKYPVIVFEGIVWKTELIFENILHYPELASEAAAYGEIDRFYAGGFEDMEDSDLEKHGGENITLRYNTAYLRALALLSKFIYQKQPQEIIRAFFKRTLSNIIDYNKIKVEENLRIQLPQPDEITEEGLKSENQYRDIEDEIISRQVERMVRTGIYREIAMKVVEDNRAAKSEAIDRERMKKVEQMKKELKLLSETNQSLDHLADLVLGPIEGLGK